eukprot:TRINITY_DN11517_c0_g1_i2.p2 TRINITY_DN11517_c0_g1~~TRINITY_DN11517_c0_g1_i2.p2  ORF type:complete len:149 (+),score=9.14 TRINITY_DN11517_c0_g1_i2:103-549(+)
MSTKFLKGSDGTSDLGLRYNPLTGSQHVRYVQQERGPYFLSDATAVPYAVSQNIGNGSHSKTLLNDAKSTCSYREWSTDRIRHIRSMKEPQQKALYPQTSNQVVGWMNQEPRRPEHGKPKCHETKVAEAHILGAKSIEFTTNITRMHF